MYASSASVLVGCVPSHFQTPQDLICAPYIPVLMRVTPRGNDWLPCENLTELLSTLPDWLIYLKFDALLSIFIRLIWSVTNPGGFGPRKARATTICTIPLFCLPSLTKLKFKYPHFKTDNLIGLAGNERMPGFLSLPSDLMLPRLETSYSPEYPTIGNQISSSISKHTP